MNRNSIPPVIIVVFLFSGGIQADVKVYGAFQVEAANFNIDDANAASQSKEDGTQLVDENTGRIGVSATEDVDFRFRETSIPLKALAKLEFGTDSADGDSDTAADENNQLTKGIALTKREMMGGLRGDFGQAEIGRLKSAYKYSGGVRYDPFYGTTLEARNNGGMTGSEANQFITPLGGASVSEWGYNGFNSDMLAYRSPNIAGFDFAITYGPEKDDGSYTMSVRRSFPEGEIFAATANSGDRHNIVVVNTDPVSGLPNGTTTNLDQRYSSNKIGGQIGWSGGTHRLSLQYERGKNKFSWPGGGTAATPPFVTAGNTEYRVETFFVGYRIIIPPLTRWEFLVQMGQQEFSGDAAEDDFGNLPDTTNYVATGIIYNFSHTTRLFTGTRITERRALVTDDGVNSSWQDDGGETVFSIGFTKEFVD